MYMSFFEKQKDKVGLKVFFCKLIAICYFQMILSLGFAGSNNAMGESKMGGQPLAREPTSKLPTHSFSD